MLKKDYTKLYSGNRHAQELHPVTKTDFMPIIDDLLTSLSKFIENNPIYDNSFEMNLCYFHKFISDFIVKHHKIF